MVVTSFATLEIILSIFINFSTSVEPDIELYTILRYLSFCFESELMQIWCNFEKYHETNIMLFFDF